MKTLISGDKTYLLRFDPGEDVMVEFKKWAESLGQNYLKAAHFSFIGAGNHIVLAFFDPAKKAFIDKEIREDMEITGIMGNIGWKKNDDGTMGVVIHAHGTVSDSQYRPWGGHFKKIVISVTCEVAVTLFEGSGEAIRELDERTGLYLLR